MMAVILAGGKGTRLKPFTVTVPKPLLPLGEIPIIEVVIRQLAAFGFWRIILTLGHMHHLFRAYLADSARLGVSLEYCVEDEPLGTVGPLRLIPNLEESFLVLNGDILTTLDFSVLLESHLRTGAWATIAVSQRQVVMDYGVVESDDEGWLRTYVEKPSIPYSVSMGINVLSRGSLQYIPEQGKFDMPDLMLTLLRAGKRVHCYRTNCYWQDIGRLDDYDRASADFAADPGRFLPNREAR